HRARDALDGDVVVRGADAARGEDHVVVAAERRDLTGDQVDLVRDDRDPAHVDAEGTELPAQVGGVGVGDLAREDLVADEDDPGKRVETAAHMQHVLDERGEAGALRVLLHSLAFGTLKPFVADPMKDAVNQAQMDMTLDVMAHSLVYWTQEVVARGLMTRGGRVYAMTSSGSTRVLPFYGPVSAAKAALESHIRQLATELAPRGITANAIRAG